MSSSSASSPESSPLSLSESEFESDSDSDKESRSGILSKSRLKPNDVQSEEPELESTKSLQFAPKRLDHDWSLSELSVESESESIPESEDRDEYKFLFDDHQC
jgi:hypothetical protein